MGAKKRSVAPNESKFAGERLTPTVLSPLEEQIITDALAVYKGANRVMLMDRFRVPPATLKRRENALRAVAGYFCKYFSENYVRETVIRTLAAAALVPGSMSEEL